MSAKHPDPLALTDAQISALVAVIEMGVEYAMEYAVRLTAEQIAVCRSFPVDEETSRMLDSQALRASKK